jgi:hypothetical protein
MVTLILVSELTNHFKLPNNTYVTTRSNYFFIYILCKVSYHILSDKRSNQFFIYILCKVTYHIFSDTRSN